MVLSLRSRHQGIEAVKARRTGRRSSTANRSDLLFIDLNPCRMFAVKSKGGGKAVFLQIGEEVRSNYQREVEVSNKMRQSQAGRLRSRTAFSTKAFRTIQIPRRRRKVTSQSPSPCSPNRYLRFRDSSSAQTPVSSGVNLGRIGDVDVSTSKGRIRDTVEPVFEFLDFFPVWHRWC